MSAGIAFIKCGQCGADTEAREHDQIYCGETCRYNAKKTRQGKVDLTIRKGMDKKKGK